MTWRETSTARLNNYPVDEHELCGGNILKQSSDSDGGWSRGKYRLITTLTLYHNERHDHGDLYAFTPTKSTLGERCIVASSTMSQNSPRSERRLSCRQHELRFTPMIYTRLSSAWSRLATWTHLAMDQSHLVMRGPVSKRMSLKNLDGS